MASGETLPWFERLATIMGLKSAESEEYPRLIFLDNSHDVERPLCLPLNRMGIPKSGWKRNDLNSIQLYSHNNVPDIICQFGNNGGDNIDIIRMQQAINPILDRLLITGGLPMHAGLVELNGRGIILAGQTGTGKSTSCRRIPHPWKAMCDDEVLLVKDHRAQYTAHPFPTWSEYVIDMFPKLSNPVIGLPERELERKDICDKDATWDVGQSVPLSAIFFMEQAEEDDVVEIGQGQASMYVNDSAADRYKRYWKYMEKEEEIYRRNLLFDNACALAGQIPCFTLRMSLTGEFWKLIEVFLDEKVVDGMS